MKEDGSSPSTGIWCNSALDAKTSHKSEKQLNELIEQKTVLGLLHPQTAHLSQEMSKLQTLGGWKDIFGKVSLPVAGWTWAKVTHHFSEQNNEKAFNKMMEQDWEMRIMWCMDGLSLFLVEVLLWAPLWAREGLIWLISLFYHRIFWFS